MGAGPRATREASVFSVQHGRRDAAWMESQRRKGGTMERTSGFLTPKQLMERLQLSENTIYHELQYGSLKDIAVRIGRQWRCSEAALERLMTGRND